MKLTKWFHGDVKPVRVGVYSVLSPNCGFELYKYWNGERWGMNGTTPNSALHYARRTKHAKQDWKWRGMEK